MRTLKVVHEIYEKGVFVNSVLPPAAPEGNCMIRTSCMANLTKPLVEEAADIIAEVLRNN